jgi:PPIC-type PPIASE domain
MSFLARLNKPWLHFIVLGVIFYKLQVTLFPEPKPVIGPLNETRLEALQQQWFASVGRLPSEAQKAQMVAAELDRDMLFQRALELELHLYDSVVYQRLIRNMHFLQMGEGASEEQLYRQALEMRLHLGDEVVKRRLIQIMEQLLLASNPPIAPSDADIAAQFAQRKDELRRPPRYSIEHLYFNREREAEFESVVQTIESENLDPRTARQYSSPFLPGYEFRRQTPDQLARHFGGAFVENLTAADPREGHWSGPIRSTYGLHYVWVATIEPERDARLEEVEQQLRRDLEFQARSEALKAAIENLRANYEVRL